MDNYYLLGIFAAMGVATFITRAVPFVALAKIHRHPLLDRFGQLLPPMIMVVLVCFGLTSLDIESVNRVGLTVLSLAIVIALHYFFRNPLLSIVAGTGIYVIGVQGVGF
ncbi:MAG: AzlD domain-containing protein [Gammaproteobacteria bacterium]